MRGHRWMVLVAVGLAGCGQANPDPVETARPGSSREESLELNADDVVSRLPEQSEPLIHVEQAGLAATPVSRQSVAEPAEDAFTKLCDAYANSNAEAWAAAEQELLGSAVEAEPTMVAALASGATHERELAAMMLAQVGADSEDARKALRAALTDKSTFVRSNAASALCACDDQSAELMTALSELLKEKDVETRVMSAMSAANLGGAAAELVPAVSRLLGDTDATVRGAAAEAIGSIGTNNPMTVEHLETLASSDENEAVRTAASNALVRIGGQPVRVPEIVPAAGTSESRANSGQ